MFLTIDHNNDKSVNWREFIISAIDLQKVNSEKALKGAF
jgi:hypothetical protein